MLVQRVGIFRLEAHGVSGTESKTPSVFVHAAALVTEAVNALSLFPPRKMHASVAELAVEIISEAVSVLIEDPLFIFRRDAEIALLDAEADAAEDDAVDVEERSIFGFSSTFSSEDVPLGSSYVSDT